MVVVHFSHKQLKYADIVIKFSGIKLEAYFIDICNLKERSEASNPFYSALSITTLPIPKFPKSTTSMNN